jgi:predicted O-methyltransferase YrrM
MSLLAKAAAFAKDYRNAPERVRNKLDVLRDRRHGLGEYPLSAAGHIEALLGQPWQAPPESFDVEIQARLDEPGHSPFADAHNASPTFARLCYALCRAYKPDVVVETGVANGVTSAYVLLALADNHRGTLYSIDLPPLAGDSRFYVGRAVPDRLRARWQLVIGPARRLLSGALERNGPPDVFIHDSLHTYSHMKWEIGAAMASMRAGGVIIADDIEGNRAFQEAAADPRVSCRAAILQEEKSAVCGAMRIRGLG